MLEPHEMPHILRMMTNQRFFQILLTNKFEPNGCIDFLQEFPEKTSIADIKEFLQQRIYQRVSKIQIYLENEPGELNQLPDHLKIDQLPLDTRNRATLIYAYDLPRPFIRAKH